MLQEKHYKDEDMNIRKFGPAETQLNPVLAPCCNPLKGWQELNHMASNYSVALLLTAKSWRKKKTSLI